MEMTPFYIRSLGAMARLNFLFLFILSLLSEKAEIAITISFRPNGPGAADRTRRRSVAQNTGLCSTGHKKMDGWISLNRSLRYSFIGIIFLTSGRSGLTPGGMQQIQGTGSY